MYKNLKEFTQSKMFQKVLIGVGIAIIALLIFQAGIFVGYRKASFSYRFGDNYYRVFGEHGQKLFKGSIRGGFIEANGAVGKIVSINLPTFVVVGTDNVEKVILIRENTRVRYLDGTATSSDLKVDDSIVVFGRPNENSQIEARLIRIVPTLNNTLKSNAKTQ
jgi:hypothetical protein